MKSVLPLIFIFLSVIKADAAQNCQSILNEDRFFRLSTVQSLIDFVKYRVSDFAPFSEHKNEIRTAYYIAAARGVKIGLIEQRLQSAMKSLNQSFVNPHEKGLIKAYFTIAANEDSPKIEPDHLRELNSKINANMYFPQSEPVKFSYLYALSKGHSHQDVLNRLKLAIQFLNQAGNHTGYEIDLSPAEAQSFFYLTAIGGKLSQSLVRVLRIREQILSGPSISSSESYIEALYLSLVN
jgi:hypothetical protein